MHPYNTPFHPNAAEKTSEVFFYLPWGGCELEGKVGGEGWVGRGVWDGGEYIM